MPTSLLQVLNDLLLALLLLFFLRVLRAVWVQLKPAAPVPAAPIAPPPGAAAPPARKGGARLQVIQPPGGGAFDIGDEVTIGRSPGCGVSLPDSTVSQVHARLFRRDGKVFVEDLGSTNGTWVNGTRISAPAALRRGDRLQVGATVLEVGR